MKYARNILCAIALILSLSAAVTHANAPDLTRGDTLYLVGYAHLDTQWRWDYPTTINTYLPKTMRDNFRLFGLYPHYIFNFSGANRYRMMKEYYPADYEKVKQFVSAGRWFPCGSSMEESDVNIPSAESIIRQILYGSEYFRKEFGKTSAEFILPDCFGFPASLPSILAHCGLKGFSTQKLLNFKSAVGIPFNVGVWEGPDGKSVVAALNPGKYGSQLTEDLSKSENWRKRIEEDGRKSGLYADFMYYGIGDRGGAPREPSVQLAEKSATGTGPVRVVPCTAEQMFLDIQPDQAGKLPRYKGDLLLTEHSCGAINSQAYMKRLNRKNELLADAAEKASVAADWLGVLPYPKDKLNNAWTLVLGGQFHDILPGTSIPKAYECSWNDDILALNQFSDLLQHAVGAVSSGLDTRADGIALTVYNPLGIDREDVVEATVTFPQKLPSTVKVIGSDGKEALSQIIERNVDSLKIIFLAKAPSVGFAVYDVQPAAAGAQPSELQGLSSNKSIENRRYRVTLNDDGDVAGIYDKKLKRELLKEPMRYAFTYDSPKQYPAWNMDWADVQKPPRNYLTGPARIKAIEYGPVRVAVSIERVAEGSKFVQVIRLSAGSAGDRIEFLDTIDWRGRACNLKAVFPLAASNPKATYNWEVGTIERGNDDPKKYEVPSHQWLDLTDSKGDYGTTVLTDCKYASDKPNDNTLRLTLLRTPGVTGAETIPMDPPKKPGKVSPNRKQGNTSNRMQATNDWGRHQILYGLAGHAADWRGSGTDWQALRMEQPLLAFQCDKHEGKLGKAFSMVRVDNPQVRIMAMKKAEDDSGAVIIRLVEMQGTPANAVHMTFAGPAASSMETNGTESSSSTVTSGDPRIDFSPYSIHTLAIHLRPPAALLAKPKSQPVTLPYDKIVTSRDGQKSRDGFDGEGKCLAAEMLPSQITDNGITFDLATANGKPNAVACAGQSISLPQGGFDKLVLLAASSDGDQTADFEVDGIKTSLTVQDWSGCIGQWDNRQWNGKSDKRDSGWLYGCAGLTPGYIKRARVAWFCSHRHSADGANEPYNYSYLYRCTITIPVGAKIFRLPDNDKIKILAACVAADPTDNVKPAQPLYDTLEDHTQAICVINPGKS